MKMLYKLKRYKRKKRMTPQYNIRIIFTFMYTKTKIMNYMLHKYIFF